MSGLRRSVQMLAITLVWLSQSCTKWERACSLRHESAAAFLHRRRASRTRCRCKNDALSLRVRGDNTERKIRRVTRPKLFGFRVRGSTATHSPRSTRPTVSVSADFGRSPNSVARPRNLRRRVPRAALRRDRGFALPWAKICRP